MCLDRSGKSLAS
ncbi:hypothetical protein D044_0306B, partial [Vibrio parahaemolyticus EKP-026]